MIREFHLPSYGAIEAGDIARRCSSSPPFSIFPGVYNPELPGCPNTLRIDEYISLLKAVKISTRCGAMFFIILNVGYDDIGNTTVTDTGMEI